jgi:hypothetical protein
VAADLLEKHERKHLNPSYMPFLCEYPDCVQRFASESKRLKHYKRHDDALQRENAAYEVPTEMGGGGEDAYDEGMNAALVEQLKDQAHQVSLVHSGGVGAAGDEDDEDGDEIGVQMHHELLLGGDKGMPKEASMLG